MKKIIIILVLLITSISLLLIIKFNGDKEPANIEPVNICGHTMAEANDPIHWHNGVYSPIGCDINKK